MVERLWFNLQNMGQMRSECKLISLLYMHVFFVFIYIYFNVFFIYVHTYVYVGMDYGNQ